MHPRGLPAKTAGREGGGAKDFPLRARLCPPQGKSGWPSRTQLTSYITISDLLHLGLREPAFWTARAVRSETIDLSIPAPMGNVRLLTFVPLHHRLDLSLDLVKVEGCGSLPCLIIARQGQGCPMVPTVPTRLRSHSFARRPSLPAS